MTITRRAFLASTAALTTGGLRPPLAHSADAPRTRPPKRAKPAAKKIAVVASIYHYLSHAYHIAGRFLDGYMKGDDHHFPDFGVASAYVEQVKANDLSRDIAKDHASASPDTIEDALTLGTGKLAVDGVLLICEHGDYPYNAKAQKLYPRHDYFQKIVAVFEKSGKSVPVFCDKHLSYDRKKAAEMVATAKKMNFPLMAGSSLPVTWRRPELEFKLGTKMSEALVASRGELKSMASTPGDLQCMVERRFPGDLRVIPIGREGRHCLQGDAVWKAGDDGLWSWTCSNTLRPQRSRTPGTSARTAALPRPITWGTAKGRLHSSSVSRRLQCLCSTSTATSRMRPSPRRSTAEEAGVLSFWLPLPPGGVLEGSHRTEPFATGKPPPVERSTARTGGILDYARIA